MNYEEGTIGKSRRDNEGVIRGNFLKFFMTFFEDAEPRGPEITIAAYGFNSHYNVNSRKMRGLMTGEEGPPLKWRDWEIENWQYDFARDQGHTTSDDLPDVLEDVFAEWDKRGSKRLAIVLLTDGEFTYEGKLYQETANEIEGIFGDLEASLGERQDRELYFYLYLMGHKIDDTSALKRMWCFNQNHREGDYTNFRVIRASEIWSPGNNTQKVELLMDELKKDGILFADNFFGWANNKVEIPIPMGINRVDRVDSIRIQGVSYFHNSENHHISFSVTCGEGIETNSDLQDLRVRSMGSWGFDTKDVTIPGQCRGETLHIELIEKYDDALAIFWVTSEPFDPFEVWSEFELGFSPEIRHDSGGRNYLVANNGITLTISQQHDLPEEDRLKEAGYTYLVADVSWAGVRQIWRKHLDGIIPGETHTAYIPLPTETIASSDISVQWHLMNFEELGSPDGEIQIDGRPTLEYPGNPMTMTTIFKPELIIKEIDVEPGSDPECMFTIMLPIKWWGEEFYPVPEPQIHNCEFVNSALRVATSNSHFSILSACEPEPTPTPTPTPNCDDEFSLCDAYLEDRENVPEVTNLYLRIPCKDFKFYDHFSIISSNNAQRWCDVIGLADFVECTQDEAIIDIEAIIDQYSPANDICP
ncbi:MAG: hypothetical protein GY832_17070 [Chloroflexi bacterium]|nr:hypothetical protein [Chloroflexota bacterium]